MKDFWNVIQLIFSALGGWLGYFLGGCDGLLYTLLAFTAMDYITGVMCAVNDKTLSSEVGFRGICRKVLIFMLVGIANILDADVVGTGSVLRTAVIFFYISNEGVSLLENEGRFGAAPQQSGKGGKVTWIIQTVKWFLTRNSVRIILDKEHTTSTASRLIAW